MPCVLLLLIPTCPFLLLVLFRQRYPSQTYLSILGLRRLGHPLLKLRPSQQLLDRTRNRPKVCQERAKRRENVSCCLITFVNRYLFSTRHYGKRLLSFV